MRGGQVAVVRSLLIMLIAMMIVHAQVSKPLSKDSQLPSNKYNRRTAVEVHEVLFGQDATGFQPQSQCKHNLDIVWTAEADSSIYQTPISTFLTGRSTQKDLIVPTFVRYVEVLHGPTGNEEHDASGNSVWPFSHAKFLSHSSPLLYDVDGDGEQEIVISTANAEVIFLKPSGRLLKERTMKLLPLRLDKNWFEGLDSDIDVSMHLNQNVKKNILKDKKKNVNTKADTQKPYMPGQGANKGRNLLQVNDLEEEYKLPKDLEGTLSAEAKESMKLIYIPPSMRAFIDELDKQDDPFVPENYEQLLKLQKIEDSQEHKKSSVYVDPHLLNTPVIIDLDGDKHDEIIFAATYFFDDEFYESNPLHMSRLDAGIDINKYVAGAVVVYDLVTMKKKWELHLDLTTDESKSKAHIYATPTVADIDFDGSLEVIVATSLGWIYVIDKHGNPKEGFPVQLGEIQGQVIVEDVNNDGDLEICAGDSNSNVVCFDTKGKPLWEKVISGRVASTMAVADLNGDKILELVIGTTTGHLWALRGDNGEVLKGYPVKTAGPIMATASIISVDESADSKTIVVPSLDGFVYIIDSKTLCFDKLDIGEKIYSQVLIDDVTGNGNMNLIITTMNGNVFNIGTDWKYHPLKAITSQVSANAFANRYNYHGIMVTPQYRIHRDEIGSTFRLEFEIVDERVMPTHIPRNYVVKVSIGGTQVLHDKLYNKPGRYQVVLKTPQRRFYGKIIVSMTNEHGITYEDSFTVGFNISFLNMFKWMVVLPFISCAGVLLYFFGTDKQYGIESTRNKLPLQLQKDKQ